MFVDIVRTNDFFKLAIANLQVVFVDFFDDEFHFHLSFFDGVGVKLECSVCIGFFWIRY